MSRGDTEDLFERLDQAYIDAETGTALERLLLEARDYVGSNPEEKGEAGEELARAVRASLERIHFDPSLQRALRYALEDYEWELRRIEGDAS